MINAAVIGMGRWGQSILNAVQGKSPRLRFIRGVTKEPDAVRDLAARHGIELSTELEDAIRDPRVEAVFLATPHSLHVDQIVAVAAAGKPVWCEKPLALTLKEAERAVAACRDAGVVFALGNNKRCFPSMREMKQLVTDGTLGDVIHIEGHFTNEHSTRVVGGGWRDDPRESPGGGFTGAGLHVLDALVNLGGPLARVDARMAVRKAPPDPRDAFVALVDFESGASGTLATVRAGPMYWRIHVFGTKGWAEARGETSITVAPMHHEPGTRTYPPADSLGVLIEAFAEAIETGKPFPVSPAQMLDTVAGFEAAIASATSGHPVMLKPGR